MKAGDKVENNNGQTLEVMAVLTDTAGSWVDPGETLVFTVDSETGIERGPYTLDEITPV